MQIFTNLRLNRLYDKFHFQLICLSAYNKSYKPYNWMREMFFKPTDKNQQCNTWHLQWFSGERSELIKIKSFWFSGKTPDLTPGSSRASSVSGAKYQWECLVATRTNTMYVMQFWSKWQCNLLSSSQHIQFLLFGLMASALCPHLTTNVNTTTW